MIIPILLLAFMAGIADPGVNTRADTEGILKSIDGINPAFTIAQFNSAKFSQESNPKNDRKNKRKDTHPSLHVRVAAAIPTENYLGSHVAAGFGIAIPLKQGLSFSLDLGFGESALDDVPGKFYGGHLKAIPCLASFQFFLSHQKRVRPYAFFGAGYMFCSFEMEDIITIPEITIEQKVKSGPCLRAGLGVDAAVSRSFGILAEAAYFYRKAQGITTITDLNFGIKTREFPVNLHAWIFQIGIKYFIKLPE